MSLGVDERDSGSGGSARSDALKETLSKRRSQREEAAVAVPVCHSCMQAFDCGVDEAYPYLHLVLHPACPLCHTPISTDPRRNHPSAGSRHGASGESAPAVSLTPRR